MNLWFMRCVNERGRTIGQFVIVKNKLTSLFHGSALLLTMNVVITAVDSRGESRVDPQTDVNFLTDVVEQHVVRNLLTFSTNQK